MTCPPVVPHQVHDQPHAHFSECCRIPKLIAGYNSQEQPVGVQEAALLSLHRLLSPTLHAAIKNALALTSWSRYSDQLQSAPFC